MRMISRREAFEIVGAHGYNPNTCTVMGVDHNAKHQLSVGCSRGCESFVSALGIHDQYAVIDVKNWLGY